MAHKQLVLALATLGGVGYLPAMPGTWGSLAAVPLWWLLSHLGPWGYGLLRRRPASDVILATSSWRNWSIAFARLEVLLGLVT